MGDAIMTGYAIHLFQVRFFQLRWIETGSDIGILVICPIRVINAYVRDILLKLIGGIVEHSIFHMPVDTLSKSLAGGAATSFQAEEDTIGGIIEIILVALVLAQAEQGACW
jgi:hypothetical protein